MTNMSDAAPAHTPSTLQTVEHETGTQPRWCVLWLHGLGADGNDFAPIVPELVRDGWPAIRFVFPHAPLRAVTINGGMRMRAWYDILDFDLLGSVDAAGRADAQGVAESVEQVDALIRREQARDIDPSRLLLAGFSQGGAIALASGVTRATPLGGIVALSTYLPLGAGTLAQLTNAARAQPTFMGHGLHDPVVPYNAGKRASHALQDAGFAVDWHAYPMAHQVCAQEIRDLGDWMSRRFAAA